MKLNNQTSNPLWQKGKWKFFLGTKISLLILTPYSTLLPFCHPKQDFSGISHDNFVCYTSKTRDHLHFLTQLFTLYGKVNLCHYSATLGTNL